MTSRAERFLAHLDGLAPAVEPDFQPVDLAEQLRGDCPFTYGLTIDFGEPMAPDSAMTAYLIFAPAVLDPRDYTDIDVGDTLPVVINGCYPIHETEMRYVAEHGVEDFWQRDWDPYDVTRPPAV